MFDVNEDDVPSAVRVFGSDPDRIAVDEGCWCDRGGVVNFHDSIPCRVDEGQALGNSGRLIDICYVSYKSRRAN